MPNRRAAWRLGFRLRIRHIGLRHLPDGPRHLRHLKPLPDPIPLKIQFPSSGWHWFRYQDNDPTDTKSDPSNRDSNKGIVNYLYEPYAPLLDSMKRINERAYGLVEHFDKP